MLGQEVGWTGIGVPGRKKPLYYQLNNAQRPDLPSVRVLGHYEATCGGCDNIGSAASVYDLIHTIYSLPPRHGGLGLGCHILCEGLLLSEDTKWTKSLDVPTNIIFLTTPVETCLERVRGRRKEAGNEKELNPANTTNRVAVIERARLKLVDLDPRRVVCRRASSEQAPGIILQWLGCTPTKGN